MTCERVTGTNKFGMIVEQEVCTEHNFWECPLVVGKMRRYRHRKQSDRRPGLKRIRGARNKALARYFGHPQMAALAVIVEIRTAAGIASELLRDLGKNPDA